MTKTMCALRVPYLPVLCYAIMCNACVLCPVHAKERTGFVFHTNKVATSYAQIEHDMTQLHGSSSVHTGLIINTSSPSAKKNALSKPQLSMVSMGVCLPVSTP